MLLHKKPNRTSAGLSAPAVERLIAHCWDILGKLIYAMIWPRRYISMVRYILIKLQIMFWLWDGADLSTLSCAKAASVMSCVWQCSSFKWCYVWTKVVIADIQDMSCFQLCIWTIDHLINHLRLEAFLLQEAGTVWKTGVCTALWLYPELLKQSDHKDTKGTVWSSYSGALQHYSSEANYYFCKVLGIFDTYTGHNYYCITTLPLQADFLSAKNKENILLSAIY